ncbi:polysaccharide deacetylase family sporulation protein PdaB [Alkalibaculum sp. M08DMB]|uniref:Polysaccharide deacetylase family sporulation protein PdaB n=1 Tax=Alkalibaculum sporogenes TaxID=2655001 RepID=A0A6A7K5N6_9FIRM|nr:polysaccharide deacetylase family sporulation protein PdaB [Alkalibaculum sporogenes]MPW24695.1 polysaccharide deacetylase family sporulation protein PdaB [Alkalibaculum sporogenes]
MKVFFLSKKAMYIISIILVVIILAVVFISSKGEDLSSVFLAKNKLIPIYSVETEEKVVAVSFDAAWGDEYTQEILDILENEEIKTTFFLVSLWIDKYPDQVKAIVKAGHEIGNHSNSHPDMAKLDKDKIAEELKLTNDKIFEFTNKDTVLFRPPFGSYSDDVIKIAQEQGCFTIQWDVDSLDWKNEGKEQIINRVVSNIRPGSIVLFHNNAEYTTAALPTIIKELKDQGYEIVPISELIYKENYTIDHTGRQLSNTTKK